MRQTARRIIPMLAAARPNLSAVDGGLRFHGAAP